MNYIRVKGHSNLARNGSYGSIVNINKVNTKSKIEISICKTSRLRIFSFLKSSLNFHSLKDLFKSIDSSLLQIYELLSI